MTKRVHGDLDADSAIEHERGQATLRFDDEYIENLKAEIAENRDQKAKPTACEFSVPITLYGNVKSDTLRHCRILHGATCVKAAWQDDFENCKDRNRKKAEAERLRENAE